MSAAAIFQLPAPLVSHRVILTADELGYGYRNGLIDSGAAIALALAALVQNPGMPGPAAEIACLLSDEADKVPVLVNEIGTADDSVEATWAYLALAWLHEHQSDAEDPLRVIEEWYAEFNYLEEMAGLVRFTPPPPGAATSIDAIYRRWNQHLETAGEALKSRGHAS